MTIKTFATSRCHFVLHEFFDSDLAVKENIDLSIDAVLNKKYNVVENLTLLVQEILEPARRLLGEPIVVTSGYRNNRINYLVGGSRNSYHLQGRAADVTCVHLDKLYTILSQSKATEVIFHPDRNYIHVAYEWK